MKETLTKTMLSHELRCDNPRVKNIMVIHHQLKEVQVVPCFGGIGIVQLFTPDYEIILLDDRGKRFPATIKYQLRNLIANQKLKEDYIYKDSEQVGFLLYICDMALGKDGITLDSVKYFSQILKRVEVKDSYRNVLIKKLITFYHQTPDYDYQEQELRSFDFKYFVEIDRVKFIEVLIMRFLYQEAYELVMEFGYEGVGNDLLIKLASRMIGIQDYEHTDELIDLCHYVYKQHKYDESILSYLTDYYEGSAGEMYQVWKGAQEFALSTVLLEEKILTLLMFSRMYLDKGDKVFHSFCQNNGKRKIQTAYLTHESYGYFIKDHKISDLMGRHLETYYQQKKEVDPICHLSLLKYYSEKDKLTKKQSDQVLALIEHFSYQGLKFDFFKKFPRDIIRAYQIMDKTFVEYTANPEHKVLLHYVLGEEKSDAESYAVEPMKNLYEGIFSKEFTLFYGEQLKYYITEESDGEIKKTEKHTITVKPSREGESDTKYERLNQLITRYNLKDEEGFEKSLEAYLKENYLVNKMFTLI